jgi:acyl-CoA synthetase (AMP-forming)/AMP-acid ligase II
MVMYDVDPVSTLSATQVAAFLTGVVDPAAQDGELSLDDVMAELAELGLPPGSAVVLALSNSVQLVRAFFATALVGLVPLAVAPATPALRLRQLVERLGVRAVVGGRSGSAGLRADRRSVVSGANAIVLADSGPSRYSAGDVLIGTSGTSGGFSACRHRMTSLLRNADRHAAAVGLTRNDVVLVNLPLYYSYAMVAQMLAAYRCGARVVLSGPPFTPPGYVSMILGHGVTHSSITPTVARQLIAWNGSLPAGLKVLTVGGDQLLPGEVAGLLAARPGGELYLTYGLTEAGPRVSTLAAHAEPARRYASVGTPLPGVRVRLRNQDEHGRGELLVESDTVLVEKLGETPGDRRVPIASGVIATGDVFRIDEGYLYFQSRLSDFVMVRGEKISLSGVREAAHAIPGVVRCATVLTNADNGEVHLDLRVEVHEPRPDSEQFVRNALNSVLLRGERPRRIDIARADTAAFQK